ncbi:ribosome maturation factor RimM [uncultured Bifidobacterium sp.]|uniref:ribosome maturation factor RimM n=1 Tax=uncultured Bifidobacterium sp. TaxID=165187 RepID=UPI0026253308|nr:ribosome maturation factor RimM [uncultured Bifidobacterium sp.]
MAHQQHADDPQHDLLRVCRIGRAQGLKGEVTIQSFTSEPAARFAPGSELIDDEGHVLTIDNSRTFRDHWILHFTGVNTREGAEALNGTQLFAHPDPPEQLADEDAFYPRDLIGMTVIPAAGNSLGLAADMTIGTVVDVTDATAQALLTVRLRKPVNGQRTALVPFVERIVPDVDVEAGIMSIDPPGGLIPGLGEDAEEDDSDEEGARNA